MNRQKKISQIIKRRLKQHRAKTAVPNPNKERYISKAERARMQAEQAAIENAETLETSEPTPQPSETPWLNSPNTVMALAAPVKYRPKF